MLQILSWGSNQRRASAEQLVFQESHFSQAENGPALMTLLACVCAASGSGFVLEVLIFGSFYLWQCQIYLQELSGLTMRAVRVLAIARGSVFWTRGNTHPPSSVSLSQMTPTPVCQRTSAVPSLRCLNVLTQREASRWKTSCASSPSAWTVWACSVIPTWCCRTHRWRIRSAVTDSEHKERHSFRERQHAHTWICSV